MGTVLEADECAVRIVDRDQVEAVRGQMPPSRLVETLADGVFAVMADPSRLRLLIALRAVEELCVCDLAAVVGLSESATSHALRLLRAQGVVKVRRAGRMAYYSLDDTHVAALLDVAVAHAEHTT